MKSFSKNTKVNIRYGSEYRTNGMIVSGPHAWSEQERKEMREACSTRTWPKHYYKVRTSMGVVEASLPGIRAGHSKG